jgi:hypothetical protein
MTRYHADLGDSDPGTVLRAGMAACVSDIRLPAGLLDRAVSRDRKRRTRNRLAGAVGVTAAMTTMAVVVATVPGRSSGHPALAGHHAQTGQTTRLQAQNAAYVLSRAAAAQANSYRMISVDEQGGQLIYTDVATQQQRIVSSLRDSSGQPYFQITTAIAGGAYTVTNVEYQHHVYSTYTTSSMDNGVRVTLSSFLPLQANPDPAIAFGQALKAGIITVVGHQSLNGRDTILIRAKSPDKPKSGKPGVAYTFPPQPPSLIWIDAGSYLVVQTEHFVPRLHGNPPRPPAPGSKITWESIVDHVTWLSPTGENLALLTVTPPPGFTKVPNSEMVQKYLGPIS